MMRKIISNGILFLVFSLIIKSNVLAGNFGSCFEEVKQNKNHLYRAKVDNGFAFFDKSGITFQQVGTVSNATKKIEDQIKVFNLKLNFINPNKNVLIIPGNALTSYSNYFIGSNPAKWIVNSAHYSELNYSEIYNGIDLKFYSIPNGIKYDYILKPGSNINQIKFNYEGAESVTLDKSGKLILTTLAGDIIDYLPKSYQIINGVEVSVDVKYKLISKNVFGFDVQNYNQQYDLIIDPLIFSTFIGGTGEDNLWTGNIKYDSQGNSYIIGRTMSANFPTTPGAFDVTQNGNFDVIVAKIDPSGSNLIFSTFIGGSGLDQGYEIIIDPITNDIYATGVANSSNFPTTAGVYQPAAPGGANGFVLKLNSTGNSLLFSTYLGGPANDYARDVDVDNLGNIYVITETNGSFPVTAGAYDLTFNGSPWDGAVTKLNSTASSII